MSLKAADLAGLREAGPGKPREAEPLAKQQTTFRLYPLDREYFLAEAEGRRISLSKLLRDVLRSVHEIGLESLEKPSGAILARILDGIEEIKGALPGAPAADVAPGPGQDRPEEIREEDLPEELKILLAIGRDVIAEIIREEDGTPARLDKGASAGIIRVKSSRKRTELIEKYLTLKPMQI